MAFLQPTSQSYEDTILRRDLRRWLACRNPEAWGQYRHSVAKGLPWFRDVEGGVCMTRKTEGHVDYTPEIYIRGILIDGFTGANSYIDAEVIITSIHNVMEKLSRIATDRCEAADNTHPVTTTEGKKRRRSPQSAQSLFPCPMPNNQACWVLGFYIITDIWKTQVPQKGGQDQQPVTMVRLERWKIEDKVWFASTDPSHNPPLLSERNFTSKAPEEICQTCHETSPRMFEEFFLCRNSACADFWKHEGEVILGELTYTKPYLQQREKRDPGGYKAYATYKGDVDTFPAIAERFPEWWENTTMQSEMIRSPKTTFNKEWVIWPKAS